ncbi:ankyrin repeat domain-containing protein 50 [Drosophila teissieri]|uniref:ankyrin repeat domain-containing protein 50 n=1 Tax=Drosophila teissieri TaxID=7243 RepID=UPI001CBA52EB|nr:ankyrin repeat domain-containing protein 50 [Drosophila teissieri]XP_043651189.1 ankyrin repeat domain-containing protein 50 [Drosophila teissieri]XP_043651190.1 ankyrin repeat domain-containing protein 50 [Drosophila teissieri]
MHSHGASKVVATLRADGHVYPMENSNSNLMHYEIRTEGDVQQKKGNLLGPATCVDLGKQLLQCARDSDVAGVKAALAHGAPFASDWLGMSALHFAAMNNQLEICEILLQGGINMDAKTKVDRTPLHLACYYGHERVVSLLLALKCSVNSRDMLRMTPLHWAVEKRHKGIVRLLLKCQADVALVSKFGKTPIGLAVYTEQADVLAELEAARQAQASKKFNEESEKETSEAVSSIMDEPEIIKNIDDREMSVEERMDVLENLRGHANVLRNTALNMLKTHGIADMVQDNDDEASKEMLNTALQNGRQLVLSEGGRMLLHETKSGVSGKQSMNGNGRPSVVALRTNVNNPHPKIRMNVIKQKDLSSPAGVAKNKNIRIISLTDFKKLYGSDNQPKSLQKIPASLASSGMVRQLPDGTKLVNMRQLQARQLKLPSLQRPLEPTLLEDSHSLNEAAIPAPLPSNHPASGSSLRGQVGTVQTIQLRPSLSAGSGQCTANNGAAPSKAIVNATKQPTAKSPNVMPLLTSSEICRQLHELRRQNEELRRRADSFQREKEEMLRRIDRLEQMVLVQESEADLDFGEDV